MEMCGRSRRYRGTGQVTTARVAFCHPGRRPPCSSVVAVLAQLLRPALDCATTNSVMLRPGRRRPHVRLAVPRRMQPTGWFRVSAAAVSEVGTSSGTRRTCARTGEKQLAAGSVRGPRARARQGTAWRAVVECGGDGTIQDTVPCSC